MVDKHYNPAIASRLRVLVDGRQWSFITQYLSKLSNAQFRTAGYMLGEEFMTQLPDADFWALAQHLVEYDAKAFLITVLKSWVRSQSGRSLTPVPSFFPMLQGREEDQRKTLMVLLPSLTSPELVLTLVSAMGITQPSVRINAYLRSLTPTTAFLLTKTLQEVEDDRPLLIRTASFLVKLNMDIAFNLASMLCSLFNLEEVKGTFSLKVQPYELSYLTSDFEAFKKALSF
ncbi:MAG: hypothetical protein MJZ60_00645 [Bacteroidaceae bacterium]|nr:hypothetical protein [Bacteroidaceae bacterium]